LTPNRNKTAYMWLAIAAMAVVSLARVQGGVESATVYSNPVLAFLAGHQAPTVVSAAGSPQIVKARNGSGMYLHDAASGAWTSILPVLFIGLVAPLSLISPRSIRSLGRTTSFSGLPEKFQRPPPALL
jgi:hypothetical protein